MRFRFSHRLASHALICSLLTAAPSVDAASDIDNVSMRVVATGFSQPLFATPLPGTDALVVLEKNSGRARVVDPATGVIGATDFLTVSVLNNSERGLLGMAFPPDYATSGHLYTVHTPPPDGDTVLTRWTISAGDPYVVDPTSAVEVLRLSQPYANHNGGWVGFGPDGYLYWAVGDGGSSNDPNQFGQTTTSVPDGPVDTADIDYREGLIGSILRLDVSGDDFPDDPARNYAIPADNPFVGTSGDDEIWAYGLRNPWRCSFDRTTGDFWIADVGQAAREEVNRQPASSSGGENYGWRPREGFIRNPSPAVTEPDPVPRTDPIFDYTRDDNLAVSGRSVTGGYVYRGTALPGLVGGYVFGDFAVRKVFIMDTSGATPVVTNLTAQLEERSGHTLGGIASFGEDATGELYVVDFGNGVLLKLVPWVAAPTELTATVTGGAVALTWADNADGETDYEVERSIDGAAYAVITTLPANTTSWTDTTAPTATPLRYRVRALRTEATAAP